MKKTTERTVDPQSIGSCHWTSPSNIALVKYWGKKHEQIPCNPSISFTLQNAVTKTKLEWERSDEARGRSVNLKFYFHGQEKKAFSIRIQKYLDRLSHEMPFLTEYRLTIRSENTFPHSSGIASSASAMSALAACLVDMENQIHPQSSLATNDVPAVSRRISRLSRLGSGSACRSIFPMAALWGACAYPDSSDEYAVGIGSDLHPEFHDYQDAILLVDQSVKKVSSSAGHHLMDQNPYAEARYENAGRNTNRLLSILKAGDLEGFVSLVESEALTLHALMMASTPGYILMHPHTLEIINRIVAFRMDTGIPLCFTLDAGPNIHLLYPQNQVVAVRDFIQSELVKYCHDGQWIDDQMGVGTQKMSS